MAAHRMAIVVVAAGMASAAGGRPAIGGTTSGRRAAVVELIKTHTGRQVSVWTAGRYLKDWGFTPQKPARRAYERDPVAVQAWLDKEYPAIHRRAKAT